MVLFTCEAVPQSFKVLNAATKAPRQKPKRSMYDFQFLPANVVAAYIKFSASLDQAANFFHFCVSHKNTSPTHKQILLDDMALMLNFEQISSKHNQIMN
jgi:hypothetical protein